MSLGLAGESWGRFDVGQEAELCAPLPPRPAPGGAPPLHQITSCRYRMRIARVEFYICGRDGCPPPASRCRLSPNMVCLLPAKRAGTSTSASPTTSVTFPHRLPGHQISLGVLDPLHSASSSISSRRSRAPLEGIQNIVRNPRTTHRPRVRGVDDDLGPDGCTCTRAGQRAWSRVK
ncbi:hypothetical protein B0H14DRAFT_363673 [Mycena olivaceomarginata]|nr:hypothetical protein B0H14DRAFT_363673 [Mycena olivaceomarginata]